MNVAVFSNTVSCCPKGACWWRCVGCSQVSPLVLPLKFMRPLLSVTVEFACCFHFPTCGCRKAWAEELIRRRQHAAAAAAAGSSDAAVSQGAEASNTQQD